VSWGYGHTGDADAIPPDLEIGRPAELLDALGIAL
jgi:hypothetical protein